MAIIRTYEKFEVRYADRTTVGGFTDEAEALAYLAAGTRPGTVARDTFEVKIAPGYEHLYMLGIAEREA